MYEKELLVAIEAVKEACESCQRVFQNLSTTDSVTKLDKSPVTIADYAAQYIITTHLQKIFPQDEIVAEEDSTELDKESPLMQNILGLLLKAGISTSVDDVFEKISLGNSKGGMNRFWTIDPVDGTKGFVRGGQYAVCLALIERGQVKVGVLGCPNLPTHPQIISQDKPSRGGIYYAVESKGAFHIPLSSTGFTSFIPYTHEKLYTQQHLTKDSIFTESVESGHSSHTTQKVICEALGMSSASERMDSQCKYACIARGSSSVYLRIPVIYDQPNDHKEYVEKIWDHAAGSLIVEEAGGVVSDINGKGLDFSVGRGLRLNSGIVACGLIMSKTVLSTIKKVIK